MAAGPRIDVQARLQKVSPTSEGFVYEFRTEAEERYIWYTSDPNYRGNVGDKYRILGAERGRAGSAIVLNRVRLKPAQ